MNCKEVQSSLSAYCDNEISYEDKMDIEKHITNCDICGHELVEIQSLISTLGALETVSPPPYFRASLHSKLETPPKKKLNWKGWVLGRALVSALCIIFLWVLVYGNINTPQLPAPMSISQENGSPGPQVQTFRMGQNDIKVQDASQAKEETTKVGVSRKTMFMVILGVCILILTIIMKKFSLKRRK